MSDGAWWIGGPDAGRHRTTVRIRIPDVYRQRTPARRRMSALQVAAVLLTAGAVFFFAGSLINLWLAFK